MKEPSILDYLKSRLNPWQKEKIELPQAETPVSGEESRNQETTVPETVTSETALEIVTSQPASLSVSTPVISDASDDGTREITIKLRVPTHAPWRSVLALALALIAQWQMEIYVTLAPGQNGPLYLAIGFYAISIALLVWAYFVTEFALPAPVDAELQTDPQTYRPRVFIIAMLLAIAAFVLFSNNLFTWLNVSLWLAALALFTGALWLRGTQKASPLGKIWDFFRRDPWQVSITRWTLLLLAITALIVFFRFYRLDGIPGEPFSDHAEKLLDVFDITQGQTHIFFPRNTGREFIQFYLTAFLSWLLGTGLTFITLKIGTVLIGLFTLPYVYLLGKEVGGKRVALFALILAGTSYWLNTISRIGLRFPLYPAFTAPALYYLIRGLRRQNRNDFILSGLFLGLGLHGYSPYRFVPFVVLLGVGLYLLHKQSIGKRKQTLVMFLILVLASFLVFLPLFRYAIENPDMFSYRALTRLTGDEQPLPAPAWQIFASNTFKAMAMFNYDDGEIWVHSVPHRPALDVVSAVLFVFGYVFLFVRYLRKRDWLDLFLFLAVPMLLMPSILSLAFPGENPSLNRTGAAGVVVFVITALALDGLYTALQGARGASGRKGFATSVVIVLLLVSTLQNYNLVFNEFATQFMKGAWNTSDMGNVIRSFVAGGNDPNNAFVVPFPYWVDTRLVGIQAGYPDKDYAINRDDLPQTESLPGSKLFIVKEDDKDTLDALRKLYPVAMLGHFTNPFEGKNFWIYTVPDNQTVNP
jgi:4-amino-4-deoxy-L-arabinose transferase-like glycosyltransferase